MEDMDKTTEIILTDNTISEATSNVKRKKRNYEFIRKVSDRRASGQTDPPGQPAAGPVQSAAGAL